MKAAVLDFDGVIARSMEQHAEAYRRILAPLGIPVASRDVFLREGARSESIIRDLLEGGGRRVDDATLARLGDEKQELFTRIGAPGLYDGARAMVQRIRGGAARMGLVTGTRRENLERVIPDLLPRFDAVLAQSDYTHDKPHPEPYAKAASALGVPPGRCVVLENAVRGVQSALAAGYGYAVAICTTMEREELREAGADVVVDGHAEAADAVMAWLGRP